MEFAFPFLEFKVAKREGVSRAGGCQYHKRPGEISQEYQNYKAMGKLAF